MNFKKLAYKFLSLVNYYYFPVNLYRQKKLAIQEAQEITFTTAEVDFLKLSAASFNYNPDYSVGYLQKPLFTVELEKATFLGNSGALVIEKKLLADSAFDMVRMSISPAYRSPAFMWNRNKKGLYTSVVHLPWAQNSNYHWFFDSLPRLYVLVQSVKEPVNIIFNAGLPRFQLDTLLFVLRDYPQFKIIYIGKKEKWTLEKFIFPAFISNPNSGFLPAPVTDFLRQKVWQGYGVLNENNSLAHRIYISRRKASKRRILNEPDLEPILLQHNFKIIFAEDLTYQEQVHLFYGATHVVAPHGAGLTNILFSQKCSVLEIQAADVIKPHYFLAAKGLGHSYTYLLGSDSDAKFNFTVNPDLFSGKLQEMLAK